MATGWIAMGPVDDTTLLVPLKFAIEADNISQAKGRNFWSEVDIVSYENGMAGSKAKDESLVAVTIIVIWENSYDCPLTLDLGIAGASGNRQIQSGLVRTLRYGRFVRNRRQNSRQGSAGQQRSVRRQIFESQNCGDQDDWQESLHRDGGASYYWRPNSPIERNGRRSAISRIGLCRRS